MEGGSDVSRLWRDEGLVSPLILGDRLERQLHVTRLKVCEKCLLSIQKLHL